MVPQIETTAKLIADRYQAKWDGKDWRMPCPAHRGDGNNLAVREAEDGRLLVRCWSHECTFNEILAACQRDGIEVSRRWVYPDGKLAHRVDRNGQPKDLRGSKGSTKGVPLLIRGDSPGALVVLCEGESDADAVLAAELEGIAAGCWAGGAKMAGAADYSAVKGRNVAIWPDYDAEGERALDAAGVACFGAGAASIEVVRRVGPEGEGQGAADLLPSAIDLWLAGRTPWVSADTAARPTLIFESIWGALDAESPAVGDPRSAGPRRNVHAVCACQGG